MQNEQQRTYNEYYPNLLKNEVDSGELANRDAMRGITQNESYLMGAIPTDERTQAFMSYFGYKPNADRTGYVDAAGKALTQRPWELGEVPYTQRMGQIENDNQLAYQRMLFQNQMNGWK